MAVRREATGGSRRETASLVVNALVTRLANTVRATDAHPPLEPTIYIPLRRGEILTWKHVAASKV